jgi:ADP-ribose pyrophosphatase YjhB (NUDIX family)
MNKRIAARAVIIDDQLNTPILSVNDGAFYKIPGGKIEEGENLQTGLNREIKEEVGCAIEVLDKIGEFEFLMEENNKLNHSICYLAKLKGDKGQPSFDEGEKSRKFVLLWLNLDKAIEIFENCVPNTDNPTEIQIHHRDKNFLKQAKELLSKTEHIH